MITHTKTAYKLSDIIAAFPNTAKIIRFGLACLEDFGTITLREGYEDLANECIDFIYKWFEDRSLTNYKLSQKCISKNYKRLGMYYNLVDIINNPEEVEVFVKNFIDCVISYSENLGGASTYYLQSYYKKLLNAFLSNSDEKIKMDRINDSVDILMLIDILLENDIEVTKSGMLNLPPAFSIPFRQEKIEENLWLRQWFLAVFKQE